MDGIFIDETPSSTEFVQYMATLANTIKTVLNRNVIVPVSIPAAALPQQSDEVSPETSTDEQQKEMEETVSEVTPADAQAATSELQNEKQPEPPSPPTPSTFKPEPPSAESAIPTPAGTLTPAPATSTAIVIYNPGVVIDPIFYEAADYVVAFENAAGAWTNPAVRQGFARLPPPLLARSIAVAHSAKGGLVEVAQTNRRLTEGCGGVFVTSCGGYTEWCPSWGDFVGEVERKGMI